MKRLEEIIAKDYSNMTGIMIAKDCEILYEQYFNGFTDKDTLHIASVTKSIVSILVGIAQDQGMLNCQQKVLDFFPDYKIKRGEKRIQKITLEDLLTMTAPYKFKSEPYTKVYSSDDWTKAALDLLGGKKSVDFKYTTVGLQIVTGILKQASGMPVIDFAEKYLFKPLCIEVGISKEIKSKEDYLAFLKEKTSGWVVDPKGVHTAGWGLALKTRDLLKIGQLCLNKGQWQEQQIVSEDWLNRSTEAHSHWQNLSYGYLWWLVEDGYAAIGDGGNIIYVNEAYKIIVAISSSFKPRVNDRIAFIEKEIIPFYKKTYTHV